MWDDGPDDNPEESPASAGIVRRTIAPDPSTAEYDLLEIVAEIEGCQIETFPSLYNEVDHVVETMFETPPSERAQLAISFSYVGYRVTIDRNGTVELVPVKQSL